MGCSRVVPRPRLLIGFAPAVDGRSERLPPLIQHVATLCGGFGGALAPFARSVAEIFARLASRRRRIEQRNGRAADRAQNEREQNGSAPGPFISCHAQPPLSSCSDTSTQH